MPNQWVLLGLGSLVEHQLDEFWGFCGFHQHFSITSTSRESPKKFQIHRFRVFKDYL